MKYNKWAIGKFRFDPPGLQVLQGRRSSKHVVRVGLVSRDYLLDVIIELLSENDNLDC